MPPGLSLIANTAPVAFGAIGTPILTLAAVTDIPAQTLGAMAGRQLPFVSLLVPAWLVVTMSGWRGLRSVWPAVLVCGGTFAIVQFAWSNYVGVELVDIAGGLASIARARGVLQRVAAEGSVGGRDVAASVSAFRRNGASDSAAARRDTLSPCGAYARAWMPWLFLSIAVIIVGAAAGEGDAEPGVARAVVGRAGAASHRVSRLSRSCRRRSIRRGSPTRRTATSARKRRGSR